MYCNRLNTGLARIFILFVLLLTQNIGVWGSVENLDSLYELVTKHHKNSERKVYYQLRYVDAAKGEPNQTTLDTLEVWINQYENNNYRYGVISLKTAKALLLRHVDKYEQAITLQHDVLNDALEFGDSLLIAKAYLCLAVLNAMVFRDSKLNHYTSSLKYSELAELYFRGTDRNVDQYMFNINSTKANIYELIGLIDTSLIYRRKAIQNLKNLGNRYDHQRMTNYANISHTFQEIGLLDSAGKYTDSCKALILKYGTAPPNIRIILGSLLQAQGRYQESIDMTSQVYYDAKKMEDTRTQMGAAGNLADIHYELGNYKAAYDHLEEYYILLRRRDSLSGHETIIEIQEKYDNAQLKAENDQLRIVNLESMVRLNRTRFIFTVIIALILGLVAAVLWSQYRKRQHEQIRRSELETKLAESKLSALKAQMNPHFLFNCMSTTQSFIHSAQNNTAFEYLGNFATLLRMTLDNSSKAFIQLEDEITQIRLYLELEEKRFKDKFIYKMHIDEDLDNGIYEVPSMIIQPFIENAIVHGILNLTDRMGLITVNFTKQDEQLQCQIIDNGVGRQKSSEIKTKKLINHKSVALSNINERIRIIKELYGENVSIEFRDLYQDGTPNGTHVIITMPLS
jgi:hypothetical protein